MNNIDREIAEKVMNWIPPLPLLEGNYQSIYQNEELGIGPAVGWLHTKTDTRYTLKEFEKYEYWTTTDGEPAKAPWGGLIHMSNFYRWTPSTDTSQAFKVINVLLEQDLDVEIFLSMNYKPEVVISYGEKHPKYPKGKCYDVGDEKITLVETNTLEMAICMAALKAVESQTY